MTLDFNDIAPLPDPKSPHPRRCRTRRICAPNCSRVLNPF